MQALLVRNPDARQDGCCIQYRDIGDYLKREEKLAILREAGSIKGVPDWREITPDRHDDWIGQRDEAFQALYPMGSKKAKARKSDEAIFGLFSNGYKTGRDGYVYNFSQRACAENARRMVEDYQRALCGIRDHPDSPVDDAFRLNSTHVRWDDKLKRQAKRGITADFSKAHVRAIAYRPFVKQYLYADDIFAQRPALTGQMFPSSSSDTWEVLTNKQTSPFAFPGRLDEALFGSRGQSAAGSGASGEGPVLPAVPVRAENRVICVPGVGANKPFSILVVDHMPDLHFLEFGQCFPRWVHSRPRGYL